MSVTDTELPPVKPDPLPPGDGERKRTRGKPKPAQPAPLSSLPKKEPSRAEVVECWGQVLSFTALVHSTDMLPNLKCEYCRDHIVNTAPSTAKDLITLAEGHPALHGALVGVTRFFSGLSAMGSIGELYAPSVIHHGPAVPILTDMTPMLYPSMPARKPKAVKQSKVKGHSHAAQPVTPAHHTLRKPRISISRRSAHLKASPWTAR